MVSLKKDLRAVMSKVKSIRQLPIPKDNCGKTALVIHHTALGYGTLKLYDKMHREERMFDEIGYNILILNGYDESDSKYNPEHDGKIVIGRSFKKSGAHCRANDAEARCSFNDSAIGIAVVGPRDDGQITTKQLRSLILTCVYLVHVCKIRVDRVVAHKEVDLTTLCPGRVPVEEMRKLLADLFPSQKKRVSLPKWF